MQNLSQSFTTGAVIMFRTMIRLENESTSSPSASSSSTLGARSTTTATTTMLRRLATLSDVVALTCVVLHHQRAHLVAHVVVALRDTTLAQLVYGALLVALGARLGAALVAARRRRRFSFNLVRPFVVVVYSVCLCVTILNTILLFWCRCRQG
jgi:hypothetical protein